MRLIIVSNRLPFTVSMEDGQPQFRMSPGGLNHGVVEFSSSGQEWIRRRWGNLSGWAGPGSGISEEYRAAVRQHGEQFHALPVFLSDQTADRFYHGFCNKTLWPLFHYFPSITQYEEEDWQNYQRVNAAFAEALLEMLRPDDVVWVHDYQLMLLPRLIRNHFPEMPIGFFLHIPFPSFEVFRLLPRLWRAELLEGLLGANLVGFHTHDYTRDFLTSVMRTLGYEHQLGSLSLRERVVKVDTFPMGIDFERFAQAAGAKETENHVAELRARCAAQRIIFSVDRLDYTKGLINRLRGYELFLKRKSAVARQSGVRAFGRAFPHRRGQLPAMKQELEETVGRICGQFGDVKLDAADLSIPESFIQRDRGHVSEL